MPKTSQPQRRSAKRTTTARPGGKGAASSSTTTSPTSFRFTGEDDSLIEKLKGKTGLRHGVQVIRLALRNLGIEYNVVSAPKR